MLRPGVALVKGYVYDIMIDMKESHIKCAFDKNHYLPGDKAFLWIDLDNSNCDLDV
jgi:hypothetical protein